MRLQPVNPFEEPPEGILSIGLFLAIDELRLRFERVEVYQAC